MCRLVSVAEWSADHAQCECFTHRAPGDPLRRNEQVGAPNRTEVGARARAVRGALLAQGGPQPGMRGALPHIKLFVARIDDLQDALVVTATRRLARSDGLIYDFVVRVRDSPTRTLCEGRISVVLHAG